MDKSATTELKPSGVRKGAWSKEEDELLRKCIEKYGEGKWSSVSERAGLNRCRKSCRLRWLNYLSPSIHRGKFSDDEVDLILRLHKLLGNRWSLIAGRIPGRTANDIKNYWNSHLSKKVHTVQHEKKAESATSAKIVKPQPQRVPQTWSWPKNSKEDEGKSQHQELNVPNVPVITNHEEEWLNELISSDEVRNAESLSSLDLHFNALEAEEMVNEAMLLGGLEEWEKLLQDNIYLDL